MKTFTIGGIHPPELKLTAKHPVREAALPAQAVVLLRQQLGVSPVPVVAKGDRVVVGQLLAKAGGFVSSNLHAPVSGVVAKIDQTLDAAGYRSEAIFIDREEDLWDENIDRSPVLVGSCDLSPETITEKIAAAGIVGMGGATFPTHVKLKVPDGSKVDYVLVNGVECEPFLTADHQLMLEKTDEILVGLSLLLKATGASRGIIGIESNKRDAVQNFRTKLPDYHGISVEPLRMCYPQGGEKQLIEALTGRRVPSGALPVQVGAIVVNVATVFAVYEAVQKKKPLVERIVTITGHDVERPGNYLVRIGTPVEDLFHEVGGLPEETGKVLAGGPMMGKALASLSVPVTKGSSGLVALSARESLRREPQPCIRCIRCVDACPMGLEPYLFMDLALLSDWEQLEKERIMDCIECGCCTYSCPSSRPLLDYLRIGKNKTGALIRSRKK